MDWPLTRAERTNYAETSRYEDVLAFIEGLQRMGAPVALESLGKSAEGREMPLVVASDPLVSGPVEARQRGLPVVYVQANIHAGEVEGKEAALILLGRLVLLVAPIYNADGNEKFGPARVNRSEQDGPALVGVRANGQGLDLNRDAIKAESPEMRGVLERVYALWEPDVMLDLHTTNGTRHGYELTYSPPLNPNTAPEVYLYARDRLLPEIRKRMQARYALPLFDYGNAETRDGKVAWYSVAPDGRYCTNYVGLRNRVGILSEATSYIPFRDRVTVTDRFVSLLLDEVAAKARETVARSRDADARVASWGANPKAAPELGVRFEFARRGEEDVLLEKKPATPPDPTSRPKEIERVRLPVYDRFRATRTARLPAAYLLPATETRAVALLLRHGVSVERLREAVTLPVERFVLGTVARDDRPFQGHRLIRLEGTFRPGTETAPAGSYVIRTAQPLAVLAFHLLEPEGTDGAHAWGFFGESFAAGQTHPTGKATDPLRAALERVVSGW
jgi:hypothetical protein